MFKLTNNVRKLNTLARILVNKQDTYLYAICSTTQKRFYSIAKNSNSNNNKNILPFSNITHSSQENQQIKIETNTSNGNDSKKSNSKYMKYFILISSTPLIGSLIYLFWLNGQDLYDENGNLIIDEFSNLPLIQRYFARNISEFERLRKFIGEPSRDKLLPDPLKYPYYQPPYTLILEFSDFLVHPEWTYENGWRFKKRPGLDKFLKDLSSNYEIIVYTAESGMNVFPILDVLDPNYYISYKLVRDSTNFIDGHHVKDLDRLNRDLTKVIVIDHNEKNVKNHPNNLFKIPRWKGDNSDRTLDDLATFLNMIATSEIEDVKEVLSYYRKFENPIDEFLRRRREFSEEENNEQNEQKGNKYPSPAPLRGRFLKI